MQARPPSIFRHTVRSEGPFSCHNICQLPERLRRTPTAAHEKDADDATCVRPDFRRFQCSATPLPPRTQLPGDSTHHPLGATYAGATICSGPFPELTTCLCRCQPCGRPSDLCRADAASRADTNRGAQARQRTRRSQRWRPAGRRAQQGPQAVAVRCHRIDLLETAVTEPCRASPCPSLPPARLNST